MRSYCVKNAKNKAQNRTAVHREATIVLFRFLVFEPCYAFVTAAIRHDGRYDHAALGDAFYRLFGAHLVDWADIGKSQ